MPARNEQKEIGRAKALGQADGQRVAFEMIDGDKRQFVHKRNRLRSHEPDKHAADEPRPGRRRDAVEVRERQAGLRQRRLDQLVERLHMRARGYLGNDAPVGFVVLELRPHNIREDNAIALGMSRRTIAVAVSSQLVSIPSRVNSRFFVAAGPESPILIALRCMIRYLIPTSL